MEFWGGGQVNEYIETVLDEGESFTELQWFLLGEKEIHLHYSTLMRFEHFLTHFTQFNEFREDTGFTCISLESWPV